MHFSDNGRKKNYLEKLNSPLSGQRKPSTSHVSVFRYVRTRVVLCFAGTVCIPLNHLCADNGGGHLKVPAAHWKHAKKQGSDSSAGEVSVSTFTNVPATGLGAAAASTTTTCSNSSSNSSCGRRVVRGESASFAS